MIEQETFPPTPRQAMELQQNELNVETFGLLDQGAGPNGAHYGAGDKNPFQAQGLLCQNCYQFDGARACEIVAGDIDPNGICKFWVIPEALVTASRRENTNMKAIKENPLNLNFSIKISATDFPQRTISGRIVTWNELGSTSAGETSFQPGSITFGNTTKLLLEHRRESPIGFLKSYKVGSEGIDAVFAIGNTTAGSDALVEASTGLRDGFSVGVMAEKYKNVDGVLVISASTLKEVSLVTDPAIASAKVTIAASEQDSDSVVEADAIPSTEGETQVETTPTVPEAAAETVEASKVVNAEAPRPLYFTTPRSPIKTHSGYMEHLIKARMGDDDSSDYIRAADAAARKVEAANDSFTTNPAFNPIQYMPGVIDATVFKDRPTIDACGGTRALPSQGMTVSHPKITTAGTVGIVAEGASTASTQIISSYVDATVVKLAGQQIMSTELLERSGPAFYDAMFQNMTKAYNRAANAAVIAEIVSGGTQASTQAATLAGIQAYVAQAAPAVYAGAKDLATAFIGGTSVWSLLIGAADSTGRNIYNAGNPNNSNGQSSPTSLKGNMMGLDLFVDSGMVATTSDDCAFIVTPSAIAIYESPKLTMSVNVVATGEVNVLLYGYFAVKTLIATGLQRYNLT